MGISRKKATSPSAADLYKASEEAFVKREAYKAQLVEAFKAGKLKSPRLIAEAKRLCAQPAKASN